MAAQALSRLGQKQILQLVLLLSILASAGGVLAAFHWNTAEFAGMGGAVGVALSFLALFAARDTSASVLELADERGVRILEGKGAAHAPPRYPHANGQSEEQEGQAREDHDARDHRLQVLRTALATIIDAQRMEKHYLTAASVISTLTWGFGEQLVSWVMRW